jgi:ribonucleotide monophosphatase NagD (HAD superfamily)
MGTAPASIQPAHEPAEGGSEVPITKRVLVVGADLNRVRDYLADFANAEEWDPGTVSCTRVGDGPVAEGATWHNESKIMGRTTKLDYRLEYLGPERVLLIGENKTAKSIDDIALRTVPSGTEITYVSDVTFNGAAKIADPLTIPLFQRLGDRTAANLIRILSAG